MPRIATLVDGGDSAVAPFARSFPICDFPAPSPDTGTSTIGVPVRPSSCVVLTLLAAACAPKSETPAAAMPLSATELEAVKAVDAAFAAGINAKDTAAVFAIYAPDAKLMPPDSPILTGAEGHPVLVGLIAAGASNMTLNPEVAYGVGDLAYVVGTATFTIGGMSETVKYAEVLRKGEDGTWRYVVDMFSGIAPPPAPAPASK